ncbi:MAG: hypothetical protein KIG40_03165 [Bacteroidaceae bacterium]|nr:hypothetical protein [Bacteroidaceae bacterium]
MEKKIYKKPEMDVLSLNIKDSVLENASRWTVDGNKEGNIKDGYGDGGMNLDSRKNESGWDFEW